ncbi:hypothetical protein AB6A40_000454 [Gnathostoma spinigerum]|uniref:Uncharacterized protein n=1 Tax=Gnathostoma spinigerum TaxID=75299 RepID=A0ABD6E256_9BILA
MGKYRLFYGITTCVRQAHSSAVAPLSSVAVRRRVVAPHYRKIYARRKPVNYLAEEFMNAGDKDGSGPRLYDYQKMGEIVRSLPTIKEKIDFVNPYERPWTVPEKTWHRLWHPALMSPRKAWLIPSIPHYFDSLDFYKYLTKMRVVDGLDQWYDGLVPPTASFEQRLSESLLSYFDSNIVDNEPMKLSSFLRNIVENAVQSLAHNVESLRVARISFAPRCESFWVRSGFMSMYELDEPDAEGKPQLERFRLPKFIGDDRRKLGELSFVLRDTFAASFRSTEQLKPLFHFSDTASLNHPIFGPDKTMDSILYSPLVYNLHPDAEPLWQCPGYEADSGETHKYGRVAIKDMSELNDLCLHWKVSGKEEELVRKECLAAAASVSLFSWLNAQAHCLGFTQYNDLESPLVSQLILSDGRDFFFAIAQLNTIAINIDVKGFTNNRTNVCFVEGPLRLYDRYDPSLFKFYCSTDKGEQEGLNPSVLSRILKMFIKD